MTRLKIFIQTFSIIFVLTTNQLHGQSDSTATKNKKNEIGLSVRPIILVTLGGTPYAQPIGLTYKRVFNKWAFRTNFTFKPYDNSFFFNNTEQIQTNDTTYHIRTTTNRSRSYIGRIGIEYRHKFKKGWYFVSGVDIQGQYTDASRHITEATYKIDSIGSLGTAEQFNYSTFKNHKNLLDEKTITKQIGLGLTIGAMVPVGKRWWVLAQFRADSFMGPSTTTTTDHVTGKTTSSSQTTFDFETGAAISEVSLFYRF